MVWAQIGKEQHQQDLIVLVCKLTLHALLLLRPCFQFDFHDSLHEIPIA